MILRKWVAVNGQSHEVTLDRDLRWIKTPIGLHKVEIRDLEAVSAQPPVSDGRVKAPIPGVITKIWVRLGQRVESGESLMVLEAMKMQNDLRTPHAGVIGDLRVVEGQTVARAYLLAEID